MHRYKSHDGAPGINIGGEQFNADDSGCIFVPDGNYHDLLTAAGWQLIGIDILATIDSGTAAVEVEEEVSAKSSYAYDLPITDPADHDN